MPVASQLLVLQLSRECFVFSQKAQNDLFKLSRDYFFLQTCYYCTLETVNQFSTFWPFNREQALHPDSMFVLSFVKFVKFSNIFLLCLFSWDIFKGYYRGIFQGIFQGISSWDFSKGFFHGIFLKDFFMEFYRDFLKGFLCSNFPFVSFYLILFSRELWKYFQSCFLLQIAVAAQTTNVWQKGSHKWSYDTRFVYKWHTVCNPFFSTF